ncbi:MAG: exo-alpha-sialidase, partial [Chloroflexia bacterium]
MNRRIWLFLALAALAIIGVSGIANASYPSGALDQTKGGGNIDLQHAQDNDGYSKLSPGLKAMSLSTLIQMGLVKPQELQGLPKLVPNQAKNNPNVVITWGLDAATGTGNEPSAVVHPSSPLFALVSGNFNIDNTSNSGVTWQSRAPANPSGNGDVVVSWLPTSPSQDWAYNASLNTSHGANVTSGRSTDRGVTWANFPSNIDTAAFFNDREYLWVDQDTTSPFYGRLYVTGTFFDTGGSGSFNATWIKWSSDNGATWSNAFTEDAHALSATNGNAQFSSVGFGPNGTIYHGWMNVRCCGDPPSFGTNNFFKWAKSTDGGVTFPISGTAASDVAARSVSFNSNGPAGFRWSPQSTLAADPSDNNVYMVWLKKRVDNSNVGVAVNITRSSDGGATWNTPSIVFNDPNATDTQYMPWITVSPDHTIHVTYSSSVNNANTPLAHFYVQSTDRGVTWSAPFQLSASTYAPGGFQGDYQANHIGNVANCANLEIIASWTASGSHHARMGSFPGCGGTPTPTVTGTLPTSTPTRTNTLTPTPTLTPCVSAAIVNGGFETGALAPWVVDGTSPAPVVRNTGAHSGTFAAFLGNDPGTEPTGNSSLYQTISVPATGGTLSYWWNGLTQDTITFDWQDAYVTNSSGTILATIMHVASTTGGYINQTFNMAPYAGQTVRIKFLVHQDGFGDVTNMYVDDVTLSASCGSTTPAPTNTAVATNTVGATPTCVAGVGAWTAGADLPTTLTRAYGAYFPTNGKFYTLGGRTGDGDPNLAQRNPLEYNPGTNTWTQKTAVFSDLQTSNVT